MTESYATQIARDWNTRDCGVGFVVRFQIDGHFLSKYPVQTAGSREHQEYWIPAEDLPDFNRQIKGLIEVIAKFPDLEHRRK